MNFDREEYNEFGVKNTQNNKKSNPNITLIVLVTVLFSVFNFIVGYMIGKFLGNPNSSHETVFSRSKGYSVNKDLLGIETTKNDKESMKKVSEDVYLDLEGGSTDLSQEDVLPTLPPSKDLRTNTETTLQNLSSKTKNEKSSSKVQLDSKVDKKDFSTPQKKDLKTSPSSQVSSKGINVKYYIQISSNEKREFANIIAKKSEELGLNTFVQEININGKKIYRVRAGEFRSYEEAAKALEKAKKVNQESFLVVSK